MSASAATPSATEELTRFAAAHPGRVHLFSPPQSHLFQAADGWLDQGAHSFTADKMARLCERLLARGAEVAISHIGGDRTRLLVRGAGGPLVPAPEEEWRPQPTEEPLVQEPPSSAPVDHLAPRREPVSTAESEPITDADADSNPPVEPDGVRAPYQRVVGELRELDIFGGKVRALEVARRRKALDAVRFRMPEAVEAYSVERFDQNGGLLRLYNSLDAENPRDACGLLYLETSGPAGVRAIHISVGADDVGASEEVTGEHAGTSAADAEAAQSALTQRLILGFALVVTVLVAFTIFRA